MRYIFFILISLNLFAGNAFADCVLNAKTKTQFIVLDSQTIILKGGIGGNILIKVLIPLTTASSVTVLKDNFCSYESAVLYIDGQIVDAQDVKQL
jgi:hypothetical protein